MKAVKNIFLILFFISILFNPAYSQEISQGEAELEMKAFDLFLKKDFEQAKPLFSQLLSLYPKEPDYNYGYGVCLIETNDDIEKAIKYLSFAATKSDNPVIYFYLGRAYHLSYKFDDALANYGSYKAKASPADLNEYNANMYIEMAKNGKNLIRFISDLVVIDNKKIKQANFHYSYELDDFGGKLIVKPVEFQSKVDQKLGHSGLMFLSDSGYVYFSSYGSSKKGSKDIYRAKKLPDGTWSKSELLSPEINTEFDEDYPFIHPDNKTLYFSSKGHNTMGGYDVFRSVCDTSGLKWSQPQNMDFPTNSPFDDILYISDAKEDYAYFASNRETSGEQISVFKIEVDKNPIEKEIKTYDEVIQKSKLEITPLALRSNKDQNNLANNSNKDNNSNSKDSDYYKFDNLNYSSNLTINDLLAQAQKDKKIVEEEIKDSQKEADLAYILADEKNKEADQKRIEAEKLKNSNPDEAENLLTEAENIDQEAIAAFNIAKVLENNTIEKSKDAEKLLAIEEKISSNENQDINTLYNELATSREELNKSSEKYSDIDTEIQNREKLISENEKNIDNYSNQLNSVENENKEIVSQLSELENRLNTTKDSNEKSLISEDITNLKKDIEENNQTEVKIKQNLAKIEIENRNLQNEISIINSQKEVIKNNLADSEKSNIEISSVNKENLKKDIFSKELIADKNNADEIIKAQNNIKTSEVNVVETHINPPDTTSEKTVIKEYVQPEIKKPEYTSTKANSIINSAVKDKMLADSLNFIAEQKQEIYNSTTDAVLKQKLENEISELNDLSALKEQQYQKKLNEAEIAEDEYLAENIVNKDTLVAENNNNHNNPEIKNLYSEGINNKNISDSLFYIADLKRNELKNTTDPIKIESLNKEINEIEELARMKKEKSDQQLKDQGSVENTIADNYISYQEDMIDNNPVFSFGDSESADSKVKQYEKELFNAKYYSNLSQSQEKKLEVMKSMQNNIEDPGLKNTLQKDISDLEKLITYSKRAAEESNNLAESLKIQATNESNQSDPSSEYLLVKATEYKAKNDFDLTKVEKETLGFTKDDRAFADGSLTNWYELKKEIETLNTELNTITDEKEKKKVEDKIELKENEQKSNFENLNSIYQESNSQEYLLYKNKLEKLRFAVSDENIVLANNLEKEADIIFDQAKIIRENSGLIENPENKNTELIKAKNLELVAIQKQKHSIDIFLENADKKDQMITAENTTVKPENKDSLTIDTLQVQNKNITLLPEEEKQLNMIRKESHIAETLESDAKKTLEDIRLKRELADKTFNPSEKSKLLKDIEKKEPAAKNKLAEAYITYGKADSLKYDLYKNQISGLEESISDLGYNKEIAKQFVNEADFYNDQAIALRQQANNETDINNKLNYLQRAVEFENKAIESQEIAVDVLMNVDPVEFASSNTLTKVDRLEVLNQPVNTEKIQEVQTKSIIDKTEFPEKDLKALDATKNLEVTKAGLENDIAEIEKIIKEQENIIATSDDDKEKKKAEKIIEKQNQILLATRFANADLSAQINDTKYWIYKENAVNYRTKGNSDDARIGRQLEKDANADYNKAKSLRDKSFFVPDPGDSYKMLLQADSLEKSAVTDMEKAYSVYLNIEIVDTVFLADNNTEPEFNNLIVKNNADISPVDSSDVETGNNLKTDSVIVENLNDTLINNDSTDINIHLTDINPDSLFADNNSEIKTDSIKNTSIENVVINPADTTSTNNTEVIAENITKTDSVQNNALNNNIVKNSGPVVSEILNYSIQPVSKYSAANPIPMNESLPEGIVFKVQIGAFKSAIKPDAFGGLNPVTGETLAGSAYTRYLVGLFKTYEGATLVKNEVNTMGYRDAFIVAYKDGKRIPLYLARNMIQESGASEKELYNAIAQTEVNAIKNRTASADATASANTNKTVNSETNTETSNQATVTGIDLKKVNGLLYTVQIGVYKQPITHDKLLNLSPIYEEKTEYGFIRYTTGIFDNQNLAEAEKNRIVKLGISDAFVTAYYNGKRLSVGDARNIENSNNKDIFADTDPVKMAEQPVINPTENLGDVANPDIIFKVQIGAYKEQVPTSVVSDFIRVASNQGLDQVKDASGITVYTVGNYKNYDQATQMKTVLMNEGIKDAFVVSYNGKQKIPVNEALRLLGL